VRIGLWLFRTAIYVIPAICREFCYKLTTTSYTVNPNISLINTMIMKTTRFSLAVVLTIYSIPTLLSGLDIYQGTEPDLSSEWIIVCIFFALSLAFFITSLLEFVRRNKSTSK
jgi:hypothetical protein